MNQSNKSAFLDDLLGVLVEHFGVERVLSSLSSIQSIRSGPNESKATSIGAKKRNLGSRPITSEIEAIKVTDAEKHRLLESFYTRLNERSVLPQAQDIHHFAQLIGMKKISGKSRKDLVPKLMRFLLNVPTDQLLLSLQNADSISESERQRGFSVLTDKLLGEK